MKQIRIKCPYCGAKALLRPASMVRKSAKPGEEVYVCGRYPVCDAYVAAHRSTSLPMGTLADRPLREKRRQAHIALAKLQDLMTRKEAYRWLQLQLGLPEEEAHIGKFNLFRCEQVIRLCDNLTNAHQRAA